MNKTRCTETGKEKREATERLERQMTVWHMRLSSTTGPRFFSTRFPSCYTLDAYATKL